MKKVLVTGGPVHAYVDDVKMITNRFAGGLMSDLADSLVKNNVEVHYLGPKLRGMATPKLEKLMTVTTHEGFDDYFRTVLALAPGMDGVILGAAVANLIPAKRIVGKFPSHNYKPGEIVPIDFKIAPRVIDEVKKVAPHTHLFGFKLLSGVDHQELIRAAYGIVLEAKATAVIANDAKNLDQKFAVTKERGVHPMKRADLAGWITEMLHDVYYSTTFVGRLNAPENVIEKVRALINQYKDRFLVTEAGLIFGTVAVRCQSGFVTTGRGKRELSSVAYVTKVDHSKRRVYAANDAKASLNAPLLARMFENPAVESIVHYHKQVPGLFTLPYAPPGSVRDTDRKFSTSFNIKEHGCMLLFDKNGRRL